MQDSLPEAVRVCQESTLMDKRWMCKIDVGRGATKKPGVLALLPGSKEVIKDITDKMGAGMAEYVWG